MCCRVTTSFHPECVDPWQLKISDTCLLCRLDLRERHAGDIHKTSRRLAAIMNNEPTTFFAACPLIEVPEAELSTPSQRSTSLSRVTFGTRAGDVTATSRASTTADTRTFRSLPRLMAEILPHVYAARSQDQECKLAGEDQDLPPEIPPTFDGSTRRSSPAPDSASGAFTQGFACL